MSKPVRILIATAVLGGVCLVWVPRLTGWDPLGLFATASAPDAAGRASLDPAFDLPSGDDVGAPLDDERVDAVRSAAAAGTGENALSSLGAVLSYLEERETERDRRTNTAVAARAVADEHRDLQGSPTSSERPTTLAEFLEHHPLSAIAVGDTRSVALFGRIQVAPGDQLLGEDVIVHAIERDGVVLDTSRGRLRIPVPPPGELRQLYRARRAVEAPGTVETSAGADTRPDTKARRPLRAGEAGRSPADASTDSGDVADAKN